MRSLIPKDLQETKGYNEPERFTRKKGIQLNLKDLQETKGYNEPERFTRN